MDLASLRLSQDFTQDFTTKKDIVMIPVSKPHKQNFIRVNPDPKFQFPFAVIEFKETNEHFILSPSVAREIPNECIPKIFLTYIDIKGNLGLWPIRLPGADGKIDEWNSSALSIAEKAKKNWLRLVSNRTIGCYEAHVAVSLMQEPEYPEMTFEEIVDLAFKNRVIESLDHPVIKKLRGEQ